MIGDFVCEKYVEIVGFLVFFRCFGFGLFLFGKILNWDLPVFCCLGKD
jgi:hypothetical protein